MPIASQPAFHPGETEPLLYALAGVGLLLAMIARGGNAHRRLYSASVLYLLAGIAVAALVDVLGVRWLDPVRDAEVIQHVSTVAVIIALFSTGIALERPLGWRRWSSTWRLLGIVMPLTIAAVAAWAHLVMGLSLGVSIVLAAALAPTDPVLAGDLGVGPPGEPDDDESSFALTSEAGLNDGLAFPFVMLGLIIADGEGGVAREWILGDVLWALGGGLAIGILVGAGVGRLYRRWRAQERVTDRSEPWIAVAAAFAVYGLTETVDAYGFLAVFIAGLAFTHEQSYHADQPEMEALDLDRSIHHGAETGERIGELVMVLLVGTIISWGGMELVGLDGFALVGILLIVVRPLATLLAFAGSRVRLADRLFLGWFGVRGIGSVFYGAYAVGSGYLTDDQARTVIWVVIATVGCSIIAHGVTAPAGLRWRTSRDVSANDPPPLAADSAPADADLPESAPASAR